MSLITRCFSNIFIHPASRKSRAGNQKTPAFSAGSDKTRDNFFKMYGDVWRGSTVDSSLSGWPITIGDGSFPVLFIRQDLDCMEKQKDVPVLFRGNGWCVDYGRVGWHGNGTVKNNPFFNHQYRGLNRAINNRRCAQLHFVPGLDRTFEITGQNKSPHTNIRLDLGGMSGNQGIRGGYAALEMTIHANDVVEYQDPFKPAPLSEKGSYLPSLCG
jgi:hypothetical protein